MDVQEVADYAQQLAVDLREAGVDAVVVQAGEYYRRMIEEYICREGPSESTIVNQESEGVQGNREEKEDIDDYSQMDWKRNQVSLKYH